jgi:carboxymethylenebutenolidase
MKAKFVCCILVLFCMVSAPRITSAQDIQKNDIEVMSGGKAYKSYLTVPGTKGPHPSIVLIHSNRGLEEGYRQMSDQLAAEGFVVLALGWQTVSNTVDDATVKQLVEDGIKLLGEREDVDPKRIGLTGFCAGGRYTMLLLPQLTTLKAGVAWYGFPYRGETQPANLLDKLAAPMLILHGTEDQASPISDIYKYATALKDAKKYFEMKVYYGEPHGFMLAEGKFRQDDVAKDAFSEMVDFFKRKLA